MHFERATRTTALRARALCFLLGVCALGPGSVARAQAAGGDWLQLGRAPDHRGLAAWEPPTISQPLWTRSATDAAQPIHFAGPAGVVTNGQVVIAQGEVGGNAYALAFDATTGSIRWMAPTPPRWSDSWSTPAIDEINRTVLVPAGSSLNAYRLKDGSLAWQTLIPNGLVNASPIVTTDRGPRDRAFITSYGGFGDPTSLLCINVDPFDPATNPYQPGEIVWQAPIELAVGNTPAYADGVVFVACTGENFSAGQILAYPADAVSTPTPLWTLSTPTLEGFYGGIAISRAQVGSTNLFAATYDFSGSRFSSTLFKIDAATGAPRWSTPCNRTASIPIVLPDGRILVSGGLQGFGTVPTIQCYRDDQSSAVLLWDSAAATWIDADFDSIMDPGEFLSVGGWSHHPACVATRGGMLSLYAGTMPSTGSVGANVSLSRCDLTMTPGQPSFVTATATGSGGTPALSGQMLYSVGSAGLCAFGPRADVNADALVDIEDLGAWSRGQGQRDVDRNGQTNASDIESLTIELRKGELRTLVRGRP